MVGRTLGNLNSGNVVVVAFTRHSQARRQCSVKSAGEGAQNAATITPAREGRKPPPTRQPDATIMATNHDQPSTGGLLGDASVVCCGQCLKSPTPGHPLRFCGRCKSVQYCDVICQRANWARHKGTCTLERDMRRSTPAADRSLGGVQRVQPLHEWYQANSALANFVMCLAWRHRSESPMILVQTSATIGKWRVTIRPPTAWEADIEAAQMVQAAANAVDISGGASSVHAQQQQAANAVDANLRTALQQKARPMSERLALGVAFDRLKATSADEFGHLSIPLNIFESFYALENLNRDKTFFVLFDVRHLRPEQPVSIAWFDIGFHDDMAAGARNATGERALRAKGCTTCSSSGSTTGSMAGAYTRPLFCST